MDRLIVVKARRVVSVIGIAAALGSPASLHAAQERPAQVADMIYQLRSRQATPAVQQAQAEAAVARMLRNPREHDPGEVEVLVTELAELAASAPDRDAQARAVRLLSTASRVLPFEDQGLREQRHIPNAIPQLTYVFHSLPDTPEYFVDRMTILSSMINKVDQSAARQFLASIAAGTFAGDDHQAHSLPYMALNELVRMGPDAIETLEDLARQGQLPDQKADMRLRFLAKNGFRPRADNPGR